MAKNNHENNEDNPNNPSEHNSNASSKTSTKKRGRSKNVKSSSSTAKTKTRNPVKKLFRACGQCCGRKKTKLAKSKTNFVKTIKRKTTIRRTKRKRSKKQDAAAVEYSDAETEKSHKDPYIGKEDKRGKKSKESKKAKKKKRKRDQEKSDPEDVPSPTASEPDHGKLSVSQILGAEAQDFTKSCCYLCAKNAMAIAAAMSAQKDKCNVSIQTSVRLKERLDTSDKSCSPMMYVRTVQSSVKVRTRDMGTVHPEKKKKSKRPRPKFNLKRFSIIPKIRLAGHPKVRHVACETEKSMGNNNVPQCRARHGAHCVPENK